MKFTFLKNLLVQVMKMGLVRVRFFFLIAALVLSFKASSVEEKIVRGPYEILSEVLEGGWREYTLFYEGKPCQTMGGVGFSLNGVDGGTIHPGKFPEGIRAKGIADAFYKKIAEDYISIFGKLPDKYFSTYDRTNYFVFKTEFDRLTSIGVPENEARRLALAHTPSGQAVVKHFGLSPTSKATVAMVEFGRPGLDPDVPLLPCATPRGSAGGKVPRVVKGAGAGVAALFFWFNVQRFTEACEREAYIEMAEVACDQFLPVPSPWEFARAHEQCTSNAQTTSDYVIGTLATPYVVIGRTMAGFGYITAVGAECAFGWTMPRGSLSEVWSPWRPQY